MRCFIGCILTLALAVALTGVAAAGAPVITKYDAHLMEREVRFNITWQSDEPVTRIIASADKEQVVVTEGIDNERNDAGYAGVIDVVVPFDPDNYSNEHKFYMNRQSSTPLSQQSTEVYENSQGQYRYAVGYSLQLVDEVNQRSTLMKDKVRRIDTQTGWAKGSGRPEQHRSAMTEAVVVDAKDPLKSAMNTALDLVGKMGSKPKIREFKVKAYADNRTAFEILAEDDKGIEQISYDIRANTGVIVLEDSLACSTEKQCSRTTTPITLNAGTYLVSAIASDGDGNKSDKEQRQFTVQSVHDEAASPSVQSLPLSDNPQPSSREDVPVISVPGL